MLAVASPPRSATPSTIRSIETAEQQASRSLCVAAPIEGAVHVESKRYRRRFGDPVPATFGIAKTLSKASGIDPINCAVPSDDASLRHLIASIVQMDHAARAKRALEGLLYSPGRGGSASDQDSDAVAAAAAAAGDAALFSTMNEQQVCALGCRLGRPLLLLKHHSIDVCSVTCRHLQGRG